MCEPTTLAAATFALGATQAVTGYVGGKQAYEENARNAISAANTTYAYQQNKINQERAAAVSKNISNSIASLKQAGSVNAAAGEAGVHGLSIDALEGDVYAQGGRASEAIDQNYEFQRTAIIGEMEATKAKTQNQINSVKNPSLLDAGLQILSSAVGAGTSYTRMSK